MRRIQKILIDIKKQRSKKLARLEKTGKLDLEKTGKLDLEKTGKLDWKRLENKTWKKSYITRYVR